MIYEKFYKMTNTPFLNSINSKSLYVSSMLQEVLSRLHFAASRQLFMVVTAEVGCGKSTSIRRFANELPSDKYEVLYLSDSKLTPRWFYKGLLDQLGIDSKFYRGDARRQLHQQLKIIQEVYKKKVVTIVDEAHLLDRETLEEIRFLLNTKMDSLQPMSLILVGQNELWDKLRKRCYAAIRQRIDIKSEIKSFDRSETESYIEAHLQYANVNLELFTEKALDEIFRHTAGTARSINKLCTHALILGAQRAKKTIDEHMIRNIVAGELP